MKTSFKIGLCIISIISLYFVVVGSWALLSVDELMPRLDAASQQASLSDRQIEILLKIEDPRFYQHMGIDLSVGQGLTTITSSLARNVFLDGKKLDGLRGQFQKFYIAVFNCCKKADFGRDMMALVLNKKMSKQQQLQLFVSSIYMGQYKGARIIGLPAAARAYFDKELPQLTEAEFVSLVAMVKAPNFFHPEKGPQQLRERVLRINAILSGACAPNGWFDTDYKICDGSV